MTDIGCHAHDLFQHVRRASFLVSLVTVLALPAQASAMSFEQIERAIPSLAAEISGDPVLPLAIDAEEDGIANADATTDGSGLYVVSPEGSLRDAKGVIIDPMPRLASTARGPRLVTGGGLTDVRFPSGRDPWLELGDGVRVRLVGRRAGRISARPGAVLYSNALAGADQLFIADPDSSSVEELLIVSPKSARRSADYVVSLPRGWKLRLATRDGASVLVVRDVRNRSRFEITAPVAIDTAGTHHDVALRLTTANRFQVVVRPKRGARVRGALAIDPIYRKTINQVYPEGDGGRPYYTGEVCGNAAEEETDYPGWDGVAESWMEGNPWLENGIGAQDLNGDGKLDANPFDPCDVENKGDLVTFSPNTGPNATDPFARSRGIDVAQQGNGVTVAVRDAKAGSEAWARMNAPDNVGVWESDFRGHTGAYGAVGDPTVRCELRVGPRSLNGVNSAVPSSYVMQYWGDATNEPHGRPAVDNNNVFFFGGYPYGSDGGGAWAQFPFPDHPSATIGAGYRLAGEVKFDADQNTHMYGRFSMKPTELDAQKLWNMPRYVEMRLVARKDATSGACSADGRWRVVFRDAVDPIAAPPTIPAGWHADTDFQAANNPTTGAGHIWRQASTSDVAGSGVKEVESEITRAATADGSVASGALDAQLGERVCDVDVSGTQPTKTTVDPQPCPTANVRRVNGSFNSDENPAPAFQTQAGPHRFRWIATDFAGRKGVSDTADFQKAPGPNHVGWYWVDARPPSCTMERISVVSGVARIIGTATEDQYADGAGIRRGSGIGAVEMWLVPYNDSYPSPHAVKVWETAPGSLTDGLRNGPMFHPFDQSITLPAGAMRDDGNFRVAVVARDGVGKSATCYKHPESCTAVDPGTLRLVRGATGVLAVWTDADRIAFDSVGRLSATVNGQPVNPVVSGNTGFVPAPPGATVTVTRSATCVPPDGSGPKTASISRSETVDRRPSIVRADQNEDQVPNGNNVFPDRFFNLNDMNNPAVFERVIALTQDPDGDQDLRDANVVEALVPDTSGRHSARAIVRIEDNQNAGPLNGADADARIVWTYNRIDANGAPTGVASVSLDESGTPAQRSAGVGDRCRPGEAVTLDGQFWRLDCAQLGAAPRAGGGFDLTLPIRPTQAAPDQRYNLDGCIHDRAQPADYRYLHNAADNSANALTPAAGNPRDDDTIQQGACARIDLGDLIVDRRPPCTAVGNDCVPPGATQPEFVRGATGARARWQAVVNDRTGNPDVSGVVAYDWTANDGGAGTDCTATAAQPAGATTASWVETRLCKNGGLNGSGTESDSPPGTRITFRIVTRDNAGNLSSQPIPPAVAPVPPAMATGSVDARPRVFQIGTGPVRFYNLAEQRAAVFRDIDVRVTDPNNNEDRDTLAAGTDDADFTDPHRIDPAEGARTDATRISTLGDPNRNAPRDFAQLVVTIDDPNDASNTDDARPSPDASARIIYTFGRTDANGAESDPRSARVILDELPYEPVPFAAENPPVGVDSCTPGENRLLQGRFWIVNCAALTEVAAVDADGFRGFDISVPIRPTDGTPFVTPDQEYAVRAYVRDRAQEADHRHLVNALDNSTTDPAPAAAEPTIRNAAGDAQPNNDANLLARSRDMGELWVDRILPDGVITFPNQNPTIVANPTIAFRSRAADVDPGLTIAPVSRRAITTDPDTFEASGVALVQFTVFNRNLDGTNGLQRLPPSNAIPCVDAAGNTFPVLYDTFLERCNFVWISGINVRTDLNVCQTVTDRAGNVYTSCRWLRIPGPPPELCDGIQGQKPRMTFDDFRQLETPNPRGYIDNASYQVTKDNPGGGEAPASLHIQCTGNDDNRPNIQWMGGLSIIERHDLSDADGNALLDDANRPYLDDNGDPYPANSYREIVATADVPRNGREPLLLDEYQDAFDIVQSPGPDGTLGTADDIGRHRLSETQVRAILREGVYVPGARPNDDPTVIEETVTPGSWLRVRAWTTAGSSFTDTDGRVRFHVFGPGDNLQDDSTARYVGEGTPGVECDRANECNQITDMFGPAPS